MKKEEFLKAVPTKLSNDDFYDLCHLFSDISLNSKKGRDENGKISGIFSSDDISKAAKSVVDYVKKYNEDLEYLKKSIKLYGAQSIDENDKRTKLYFDKNTKGDEKIVSGILYSFTSLPNKTIENIFFEAQEYLRTK